MSHIINIVYYIWINPKRNWKVIIEGQLSDMKISKIFEAAKLYIVLSCADNKIMNEAKNIINNSLKDINNNLYEITTTHENNRENRGFPLKNIIVILQNFKIFYGKNISNLKIIFLKINLYINLII
jgi:hypothetical protein